MGCRTQLRQFQVLATKQFIVSRRNWKGTAGNILCPIFICLLLLAFQGVSNYVLNRDQEYPTATTVGPIPRCVPHVGSTCVTIRYCPNGVDWVDDILKEVAALNNLDFSADFSSPCEPPDLTSPLQALEADMLALNTFMENNPNTTQAAVWFFSAYLDLPGTKPVRTVGRTHVNTGHVLYYNYTATNNFAVETKRAFDEAVYRMKTEKDSASFDISTQPFPVPKMRIAGFDVVAANGGIWFYIPPMVIFFTLLTEIVQEKEQRLRLGMRMMGLTNTVYWSVWMLTGIVFVTLSTWVLIGMGAACQFDFFLKSNFAATFLLFFLFGMATVCLAFFCSTLISSVKTAQTVGYGVILVGFVFQTILCSADGALVDLLYSSEMPKWVYFIRGVLTCYPPFNLAKAYYDISILSSATISLSEGEVIQGPGFHWSDMYTTRPLSFFSLDITVPAPYEAFLFILMDGCIFAVLAFYLDNVLAGEHGSPKPLLFFLMPSYWGCGRRRGGLPPQEAGPADEDEDVRTHRVDAWNSFQALPQDRLETEHTGMHILGMTKTYRKYSCMPSKKDVHALIDLSLHVSEGEIFCLLGPNGSGKTTLINVLTGIFNPTRGEGYVFGRSVLTQIDAVRSVMGVCPQHDILWGELTAIEHLRLFAKLKGMSGPSMEEEIRARLASVQLSDVGNNRVSTYSGGMKRRLSVAISSIGDPRIIFMDEPTTGMDPVTREEVWTLIQDLKKGRIIFLTTHSMEEADVLGDRIGMMVYGRLRCYGTALHLKNKHGAGYRVSVSSDVVHAQPIIDAVAREVPQATVQANNAGAVTFAIPTGQSEATTQCLKVVETLAADPNAGIKEWGMSHSSLEDVFLTISKRHGFTYPGMDDAPEDVAPGERETIDDVLGRAQSTRGTKSHPYRALFRKNCSLQKREKFTNCCQIVTPVFVMIILVILQFIIRAQLGSNFEERVLVELPPWPLNGDYEIMQEIAEMFVPPPPPTPPYNATQYGSSNCLTYFFVDRGPNAHIVGTAAKDGVSTGLLAQINPRICKTDTGDFVVVPYFEQRTDVASMQAEIFNDLGQLDAAPMEKVDEPPLSDLVPDGFVSFGEVNPTTGQITYTISVNDAIVKQYHRANNFTRIDMSWIHDQSLNQKLSAASIIPLQGRLTFMEYLNEAFLRISVYEHKPNRVYDLRLLQAMPYYATADLLVALELFGTMLYPVALSLQLPMYIYLLVLEKAMKLREMMKSMGLRMRSYIITNCLFFFVLYSFVVVFFWAAGAAVQIRFFTQTHWSTLIVFFIGWGLALISLAFFFAAFLSSTQAAMVLGYVIALIGTLIGLVICVGIYGIFVFSVNSTLPVAYLIWPQFSMTRGIYLMNLACAEDFACYGPIWELKYSDEFGRTLLSLYIQAIVFFLCSLYLDAVLPQEFGVQRHPCFPCRAIRNRCCKPRRRPERVRLEPADHSLNAEQGSIVSASPSLYEREPLVATSEARLEVEDANVAAERTRVNNGDYPQNSPVIVRDLAMRYPAKRGAKAKDALRGLCLVVEDGQCFGLLGENGAGKTTTISILTGVFPPTGGSADVAGYSILTDIDNVHLGTGLCPQFNILWPTLTVEEHMLFYARLKGIPPSKEKVHVKTLLSQFGLWKMHDRPSKALSGGMQRRLSVAISLVGHSAIVFLDEPTTGLDPVSRRQLWEILQRAKSGRAMILTTHSMDEADLLSTRIGIMARGQMRVLGSQQHLKSTLGGGYRLFVNFLPEEEERVTQGVLDLFPAAKLHSSFRGSRAYYLPRDLPLSEVFITLETRAASAGIVDWGVSQVGLADVFQRVVELSRGEEAAASAQSPV